MSRIALLALTLSFALVVGRPGAASAQAAPGGHVSVMGGISEYDLSGVEQNNLYAVRLALPLRPSVLVEGSLSYVHTRQDFGRTDLWIPEVQAQLQGRWRGIAPYVGVGLGVAIDSPEDVPGLEAEVDLAPSAALGVRGWLTERVGFRVEGRVHGVEVDFTGTVSELTAGVMIGW